MTESVSLHRRSQRLCADQRIFSFLLYLFLPACGAGAGSDVVLYGADSSGSGTCRCPFVVGGSQSLPHLEQYFSGAVRTLLVRERLCGAVPVVPAIRN